MNFIPVPESLLQKGYTDYHVDGGASRKRAFHRDGREFLKQVADSLGLAAPSYDIDNDESFAARSGNIALMWGEVMIWIGESFTGDPLGLNVLYRARRNDSVSTPINRVTMVDLSDPEKQKRFMEHLVSLSPAVQATRTHDQIMGALGEASKPEAVRRHSRSRI